MYKQKLAGLSKSLAILQNRRRAFSTGQLIVDEQAQLDHDKLVKIAQMPNPVQKGEVKTLKFKHKQTGNPNSQKMLKLGEATFNLVKQCAREPDMSMKEAWRWLKDAAVRHQLREAKQKQLLSQLLQLTGTVDEATLFDRVRVLLELEKTLGK